MFYIKPAFFDDFKCIASECTDSCCIGWEIDVDDASLVRYNKIDGDFGEEIRNNIIEADDGSKCFRLCEGERCFFLDGNNLCRIILNSGKEALCDICREHPRFYNCFPGVTECGLGLCCEEACRLLLEDNSEFNLVEENDGEKIVLEGKEETAESDLYILLSGLREVFFEILFKNDLNFEEKLVAVLEKTERFCSEKCILRNDYNNIKYYLKTEPINEDWTLYINQISSNLDEYLKAEKAFDEKTNSDMFYLKILAYIIYRHFIKAVFDGEYARRIAFCIESVRFIKICDIKTFVEKGELTLKDRIENLKNWSKQIEYSEENTDILIYGDDYF